MPEITNTWGVCFMTVCIIAPYIVCYYIGKSEKKNTRIVKNNNHPSILDWDDYGKIIKKSA